MTLSDLMTLCAIAHEQKPGCWFVRLSGHVNKLEIEYFPCGWSNLVEDQYRESLCEELTPDGIAGLYYFVRNRTNL